MQNIIKEKNLMLDDGIHIYQESDIPWQLQNKIHCILNIAYKDLSKSFIAKTYADLLPQQRIVWIENGDVIAHIAIMQDKIKIADQVYEVGCLGLLASLAPRGAARMLKASLDYLKANTNFKFAISKSNNKRYMDYVLVKFEAAIFDGLLLGKTKSSKETDKIILFKLSIDSKEFNELIGLAKKIKKLTVELEPF